MVAKIVLFVCAQAAIMQSIAGQCISAGWAEAPYLGSWASAPSPAGSCGASPSFSGGYLPVTSSSRIAPTGVSVTSENAYCGDLSICGAMPFLGALSLEGALPTAGSGSITYGCGNGEVAMLTEDIGAAAIAAPISYGYEGFGGCGCRRAHY